MARRTTAVSQACCGTPVMWSRSPTEQPAMALHACAVLRCHSGHSGAMLLEVLSLVRCRWTVLGAAAVALRLWVGKPWHPAQQVFVPAWCYQSAEGREGPACARGTSKAKATCEHI